MTKTITTKAKHPTVTEYKLQPFEKETIILWNQSDEPATIETWSTKTLIQLQNNPDAVLEQEELDVNGNIVWQRYSIPKSEINVRQKRELTDAEKAKRSETAKRNLN